MAELTKKQLDFIENYIQTGNASEAYRAAYNSENMKPESINRKAKDLLDNVKIAARIKELREASTTSAMMSRQELLEKLSLIARADITDIVEFKTVEIDTAEGVEQQTIWRVKESAELQALAAASIKSVTMTKFGPKIEMHDRLAAMTQISKLNGWDSPSKLDITSSDGALRPVTITFTDGE